MRLSEEEKLKIVEMQKKGASLRVLAQNFPEVSKSTIRNVLKQHGAGGNEKYTGRRALSDEEEQEIVVRYTRGETPPGIARAYRTSSGSPIHAETVRNVLRRRGVQVRPDLRKHRLQDCQKALVVRECQSGSTIGEAAAQFQVSEATVARVLRAHRRAGVVIELPAGRRRTYRVNERALDADTAESLYWAGFLLADGCVSKDDRLVCVLAERDRGHLGELRAFLGSTHPIHAVPKRTAWGGPFAALSIRSAALCDRLVSRWGGARLKIDRLPQVALRDSRDFWRGTVDGDGWLGASGGLPFVGLCGQRHVLDCYRQFLAERRLPVAAVEPAQSGIWRAHLWDRGAASIIDALYSGAAVALDRKRERAARILGGDCSDPPAYASGDSSCVAVNDALLDFVLASDNADENGDAG